MTKKHGKKTTDFLEDENILLNTKEIPNENMVGDEAIGVAEDLGVTEDSTVDEVIDVAEDSTEEQINSQHEEFETQRNGSPPAGCRLFDVRRLRQGERQPRQRDSRHPAGQDQPRIQNLRHVR